MSSLCETETKRERERDRERHTVRQRDRQIHTVRGRQLDRLTDCEREERDSLKEIKYDKMDRVKNLLRQTDRQTGGKTIQIDQQAHRETHRKREREKVKSLEIERERQTGTQGKRERERERER
ncbi:hypothetical protein EGW08_017398 [Elysia chlorotica]|uniref:Uncharacterized protein n=1 Tax=Elysia chlorotica TaxID=188477 RepID=A0A3S1B2Y2_ELYCH|nr:hypothetical protein EGW08_017398 [Elysia chlorotica]